MVADGPVSAGGAAARGHTPAVGRSLPRKEDRRLLTGTSRFIDDLRRPGALRARILRSPHAHARIASIDTERARAHRGVATVITAADLPGDLAPIPMRMYPRPGMEELLQPVGKVVRIPESQQDAATALSGSGPAYVYFLVEAMVDAGILLGVPRQTALDMVIQAVYGAATMLRDSGEHPVILREAVTSPGGTTISAVAELERHRVRAAFLDAIEAARDRGRELGGE